jgi:hypothetical protein
MLQHPAQRQPTITNGSQQATAANRGDDSMDIAEPDFTIKEEAWMGTSCGESMAGPGPCLPVNGGRRGTHWAGGRCCTDCRRWMTAAGTGGPRRLPRSPGSERFQVRAHPVSNPETAGRHTHDLGNTYNWDKCWIRLNPDGLNVA